MRRWHAIFATLALLSAVAGVRADEFLRDPTRPYTSQPSAVVTKPSFTVNAIIVSDDRRLAIVNGKRVMVGAEIDGATVVSITKHELVLELDGEQLTLGLNGRKRRQ